jgi:signal transduction histidine kinase
LEKRVNERTVALENSIQELKTTQAQMIQREKMASLGELTAGIAHEIQNPLNFVNNFSEVNQELLIDLQTEIDKGNDKAVVELLQDLHSNNVKINQHGKRADSIIKSMLQHSRSSSGDKESTDLNALCDEYLQLSYHGMRAKEKDFNVKIHSTLAKDLPLVRMVPQDIGRVLMNLLNNAFYAARKSKKTGQPGFEPQVSLTTATQERMVTISITDNGDGIPEDLMKKIFQPFFTTKPTGEGTGLGLYIAKNIIEQLGGEIWFKSIENVGSVFSFSLPIGK